MAWNEPGNDNKNKDPWGSNNKNDGPPDLDEVFNNLKKKFGQKGGNGQGGGDNLPSFNLNFSGFIVIFVVGLLLWLSTGFYTVEPAEKAIILRFGAYSSETGPGLHWHIPTPVERVYKINVSQINSFTHKSRMLTKDENIVDFELTVQWKINDAYRFVFQDSQPIKTIRDITETVVRETIGKTNLDYILTEGRDAIAIDIHSNTQKLINRYNIGVKITSINMQPAKPPEEVKDAFDDAIKAREDKERSENQAEAYANEVLPKARGAAARVIEEATAYRNQVIAKAEGETARFLSVKAIYDQAPEITLTRLYIEMSEAVLSNTNKVLLDADGSNNLTFLPLDKLINQANQNRSKINPNVDIPLRLVPSASQLNQQQQRFTRSRSRSTR